MTPSAAEEYGVVSDWYVWGKALLPAWLLSGRLHPHVMPLLKGTIT